MTRYAGPRAPEEFQRISGLAWAKSVNGMAIVTAEGYFRHINPSFANLIEYTSAEIAGKHFAEITHPQDVSADRDEIERVMRGEIDSYVMRKRCLSKTGRVIWIKMRVDAVPMDDGELEFFYAQMSPADQVSPPTFPGQPDRQAEEILRKDRLKLIKWGVGLVIGAAMAVTGAITNNQALLSVGAMVVTGAMGGAVVEGKLK